MTSNFESARELAEEAIYPDTNNAGYVLGQQPQATAAKSDISPVSNDAFLTEIFGTTFKVGNPLVCMKRGDPDVDGWYPKKWPCDTDQTDLNWYALPSLYRPDDSGRYRAKKELAVSVHAVMVDDVGTKVSADRFVNCRLHGQSKPAQAIVSMAIFFPSRSRNSKSQIT